MWERGTKNIDGRERVERGCSESSVKERGGGE